MAESWSIEEEKQLQALMAKKVVAVNESRGAAMSDGSKRRYVDEESVGSMDNPWIEVSEKSHLKVDYTSVELDLPMGITSMEQWGRTVISFGKYAEANVTYNEMLTAPEYAGYRKWCKSHLTNHTAGKVAMDFVKYRDAYERKSNKDSGFCSQELRWSAASSERSMWDLCTMSSGLAFNGMTAGWEQVQ